MISAIDKTGRREARCFVIQPFGNKLIQGTDEYHDHDEVYNALEKLRNIDPKFPIDVFRADNELVGRENLATHVQGCIESADFCIADITGRTANAMFEIGYARGRGLKVIVICKEKEEIPSDLKGIMYVDYNKGNLSGLAARVRQHFKRVEIGFKAKDNLQTVSYLPKRNDELIRKRIRSSTRKIDILQTNLSVLQRDFLDDISAALDSCENLTVRILTLNPQSVFVNYRAEQLEDTEVRIFRAELTNALEASYAKLKKYESRVSIKIYDDFPAQISFFFDDEILACVVSAMGRSRNNCAFIVPSNFPNAENSFERHFSHLWNNKHKSRAYREYGPD
ncbi:MAG: hypothetical protein NT053_14270 [Cyanobacteria bacterium]|nr:hypothetical protein [Cyanobacteriota bacterium]